MTMESILNDDLSDSSVQSSYISVDSREVVDGQENKVFSRIKDRITDLTKKNAEMINIEDDGKSLVPVIVITDDEADASKGSFHSEKFIMDDRGNLHLVWIMGFLSLLLLLIFIQVRQSWEKREIANDYNQTSNSLSPSQNPSQSTTNITDSLFTETSWYF